MTAKLEFWKVLVVSTGHLRQDERDRLCEGRAQYPHRDGWGCILWIGTPEHRCELPILEEPEDSPGLSAIVKLAWAQGCSYVAFDADADAIEGVETYE